MEQSKTNLIQHFNNSARFRSYFFHRNYAYHEQVVSVCRQLMHEQTRVLELGCSTGDLLNTLQPSDGVGVDISPKSIELAQSQYPQYTWVAADVENLPHTAPFDRPFDLIVISDLLGYVHDIQLLLERLHPLCHEKTRIVISHWNWMWAPLLKLAETLRLKTNQLYQHDNWLSPDSLNNMLYLADFHVIDYRYGLLLPMDIPLLSPMVNALSRLPLVGRLALSRIVIARPTARTPLPEGDAAPSVSVIIPTRNERGNIETAVLETPVMGSHTELIFIDGSSTDGTIEEIQRMMALYPERNIRFLPQQTQDTNEAPDMMLKLGKGDAVRKAFSAAQNDILMILDSDLTVPPYELEKFYRALVKDKGRFINGSRLVYPQEQAAMRPVNRMGNIFFSYLFTWLLDQPISDTLCGTKVLYKADYDQIAANRSHFGDFDPFGDFDLLFGAAHTGLPIVDLPVHYRARTYGDSKVRVNLHGPLLIRMSGIAFMRLKLQRLFKRRPTKATNPTPSNAWIKPEALLAFGVVALMSLLWLRGRRSKR